MKISFVKGKYPLVFVLYYFLLSADLSGKSISAGHALKFQENHQNRDLLAFVPATVEDYHLVNIRHLSKVMVPPQAPDLQHTSQRHGPHQKSTR
jgi:hypothetical protein